MHDDKLVATPWGPMTRAQMRMPIMRVPLLTHAQIVLIMQAARDEVELRRQLKMVTV